MMMMPLIADGFASFAAYLPLRFRFSLMSIRFFHYAFDAAAAVCRRRHASNAQHVTFAAIR